MPRILIVDDEPDMRLAIKNVLKLRGYEIFEAGDGLAALDIISKHDIHLMLLDIRLPGMDGIEVLERTRKINRLLPVVMITGYGHIRSAVDVMKLGANEYLQKPFENTQLVKTVKRFLDDKKYVQDIDTSLEGKKYVQDMKVSLAEKNEERSSLLLRPFAKKIYAAIVVAAIALFIHFSILAKRLSYHKVFSIESSNISSMAWDKEYLWTGDWVEETIYQYRFSKNELKLKKKYKLAGVHISGIAVSDGIIYISDSWKKNIQKRKIDDNLTIMRKYSFSEEIINIFYDGEYLWSCDTNGTLLVHRMDDSLSVISSFKLSNRPDQIFKQKKNLWSAISSTKKIYKHNLDDKLSIAQAYKIKDLPGDSPLSSFSWKDGKLWIVRDGIKEITQMGMRYLKTDD
ncbi:MAG: response regulator [Elusimicrobia bacterium]|nr:response regulator [Elusimicrobiota bacterium]